MATVQVWESLKEAITTYTGLSPATFFTVTALALAIYYVFSGSGSSDNGHNQSSEQLDEPIRPLRPPVQLGEITEEELKHYDGSDPDKPLLMAIKGQIYDVSQSRMFYGPGGPYALFAGKDASRALAKMSFEEKDLTGDISGLGPFELDALQDWEYKFQSKYFKVGSIKKTVAEGGDATANGGETSEATDSQVKSTEDGPSKSEPSEHAPPSEGVTAETGGNAEKND